ncbi:MAG: flagellar hook-basal body complex protein FliE [Pseudomonadota bacterium]
MIEGISALAAANRNLSVNASGTTSGATPTGATGTTSFSQTLTDMGQETMSNLARAEAVSMQALSGGDAGPREVAEAVMAAERSLQMALAVRDKVVTAYLEVSRMAI